MSPSPPHRGWGNSSHVNEGPTDVRRNPPSAKCGTLVSKMCEAAVQASQWQARRAGVRSLRRAALGWLSRVAADTLEPLPAPSETAFRSYLGNFPEGWSSYPHDFPQLGCLLTPETWLHISFNSLKIKPTCPSDDLPEVNQKALPWVCVKSTRALKASPHMPRRGSDGSTEGHRCGGVLLMIRKQWRAHTSPHMRTVE